MRSSDLHPLYEWLYLLCCAVFTFGLFLDGWAHNHLDSALETFFTPWHAVFYTGYLMTAVALFLWTAGRRSKMGSFIDAVPVGHGLSIVGALLFMVGGMGDMLWHVVFGVEADIDALLSPTHLLLAVSMTLMLSGGMRHFWATRKPNEARTFGASLPLLFSAALTISVILFMLQFGEFTELNVTGTAPHDPFFPQSVSLLGMIVFSVGITGMVGLLLQRDMLPFGSITVLLTVPAIGFAVMRSGTEVIPAALLAGALCDIWLHFTETKVARTTGLRILFFLLPALYYALVLLFMDLRFGTLWWSVHMLAGAPVLMGFIGMLMSFVAWPPRQAKGPRHA